MNSCSSSFIARAKTAIDTADVISFDIFDTLLIRPYVRPWDLFRHLEERESATGFAVARVFADIYAKRWKYRHMEDITLDHLYSLMPQRFEALKSKEAALELQVLRANPELSEVYRYAQEKKKRIIIVSNMYLSIDVIEQSLAKNGFIGYEKFYLSSYLNKRKSLSLFNHVIEDLGVSPHTIVHIGDNTIDDNISARRAGMNVVPYMKVLDQFFQSHTSNEAKMQLKRFRSQALLSISASVTLALASERWHREMLTGEKYSYWNSFGYKYAAPLIFSFVQFIKQQSYDANIEKIWFLSRDCFLVQKIYQLVDPAMPSEYVYAPRKTAFEYGDGSSSSAQAYATYIRQLTGTSTKMALVDSETAQFTGQKFIQKLLGFTVLGLYWQVLLKPRGDTPYRSCVTGSFLSGGLLEFIMTSPELPITEMQGGTPVYQTDPSSYEVIRSKAYEEIVQGGIAFVHDMISVFGDFAPRFGAKNMMKRLSTFTAYPTEADLTAFAAIYHSADEDHRKYTPTVVYNIRFIDLLREPRKNYNVIKEAIFRRPWQKMVVRAGRVFEVIRAHYHNFK